LWGKGFEFAAQTGEPPVEARPTGVVAAERFEFGDESREDALL
jgi:hypothetical protein